MAELYQNDSVINLSEEDALKLAEEIEKSLAAPERGDSK